MESAGVVARYRSTRTESHPSFPTVQGMVFVANKNEVWSSETVNSVCVRSSISSSFLVTRRVTLLDRSSSMGLTEESFSSCAVALCAVTSFGMMWCALTCGRLVLVDMALYSPKLLYTGDVVRQRRAVPVHSMVFCDWHASGSVVSTSVFGVVTVWDAKNLVPLSFLNASGSVDPSLSRVPTPSKCMTVWEAERFVLVGVKDSLVVVDGTMESCTRQIPLGQGEGDALSMAFSPAQRTLWVGRANGSLVKVLFSADAPEHLSPHRRPDFSAVQRLADSLEETGARLLDRVTVHVCAGVHRSYVHKVACTAQNVITCGGDGSTCVVDAATGFVLQRVTLEDGLCARELVVIGSEVVLFSLTDRSLRSLTLRATAKPQQQQQADSRGGALTVTPRHSGTLARSGALTAALSDSPSPSVHADSLSARQLIQHCVYLLQALQNLQTTEAQVRRVIEDEEGPARSMMGDFMQFRLLSRYASPCNSLTALEKLEITERLYLLGVALEERELLLVGNFGALARAAFDETVGHVVARWHHMLDSLEVSSRMIVEGSESESRGHLRWGHAAQRRYVEDLSLCTVESAAADKVIRQLEQTVQNSVPARALHSVREGLEAALSKALDERQAAERRIRELEGSTRSSAAAAAATAEVLESMKSAHWRALAAALVSAEGEQRAHVEQGCAEAWSSVVLAAHSSALLLARGAAASKQDDQRTISALETEVAALQLTIQSAQREQRSCRSSLDATVIMKRKLEADVADLRAQIDAADERGRKYESELTALDLEVMRLRTHKVKLEERLEGATSLAEESCATAAQQQQLLRSARQGMQGAKEKTVTLFNLFEASATMQVNGPLTDARSLLRDALYDLADARRCQAANMSDSLHGSTPSMSLSGARCGTASMEDEVGYLQGAFEKLKRIQDGCFSELQERMVMVDRQDCFNALRALLKSLEVVNSL
jgi:hypothetical protein